MQHQCGKANPQRGFLRRFLLHVIKYYKPLKSLQHFLKSTELDIDLIFFMIPIISGGGHCWMRIALARFCWKAAVMVVYWLPTPWAIGLWVMAYVPRVASIGGNLLWKLLLLILLKKKCLVGVYACDMKTDLVSLLASKLARAPKQEYLGLTLKRLESWISKLSSQTLPLRPADVSVLQSNKMS